MLPAANQAAVIPELTAAAAARVLRRPVLAG